MFGLLAIVGCGNFGPWHDTGPVDEPVPSDRLVASPARIDFGTVSVVDADEVVGTLTLYNLGDTPQTVTGHDEPIGSDAFVVDAPAVLVMAPGDTLEVPVYYAPITEQSDVAELLVAPSGETVRLTGVATAPVLEEGAPEVDPVVLGCEGEGYLPITNAGSEELVIDSATLNGGEYALVSFPETIAPGASGTVELAFTPAGGGNRGAILVLNSNDPLRPAVGIAVSGLGYEGAGVTESFRYTPSNPTDLLFVIATGEEMTNQLGKAADVLPGFVDTLRDTNLDYHLAALSSVSPCPSSAPGWADRADTTLQTEVVLERGFSGSSGLWEDDLLGLAVEALARTEEDGCLAGFRRAEADLHVIVVAGGPSAADVTGPEALLDAYADAPAALRVSALVPLTDTCGSVAADYAAVAERHDGTASDLCASDWTAAFEELAKLPEGRGAVRYELAEEPVPATIEVLAEGNVFEHWTWDAEANAIVFDGDTVPALGAEITVGYVLAVACDK